MPGIPTLKSETVDLFTLREHWIFLLVRVQSEPLAGGFAPPLIAFGSQWDAVARRATELNDAVLRARAVAIARDNILNRLSDQVSAVIHEGKQADVSLPLHQLYFGSSTPSEVKRPILGTQLEIMRLWPGLLTNAIQPALVALAPSVTTGVEQAEEADATKKATQLDKDKFELDGELKQLFDTYNALAATTFGGLKAIVHDQPELRLGGDWAESFFLHESRSHTVPTLAQADVEVQRLKAALAAAEQRAEEIKTKQDAAAAAAAAEAAARAAVVAAKKETAAAKQKEKDAIAAAKKTKKARR